MTPAHGAALAPGMDVDVRDKHFRWFTGRVRAVASGRVCVSYDGRVSRWAEWIPAGSPRLAELYTHTPRGWRTAAPATNGVFVAPDAGTAVAVRGVEEHSAWAKGRVVEVTGEGGVRVTLDTDAGPGDSLLLPAGTVQTSLVDAEPVCWAAESAVPASWGGVAVGGRVEWLP